MKKILNQKNNNELKRVQKILLNQMDRLDDEEVMKERGKREIGRSGALSQQASQYIKTIATQLKILETANKYNVNIKDINKYLGIEQNEKDSINK